MKTNMMLVSEITSAVNAAYDKPAEAREMTINVGDYRNTVVTGGDPDVQAAGIINICVFALDAALPDFDAAVEALEKLAADRNISYLCRI